MSFLDAMNQRYTTKMYDDSKKIDPQQIEELKEILRLSPSSINSQPWKFTFISSSEKKEEIALVSFYNDKKIRKCDTVVVFSQIDNIETFQKQITGFLPQGQIDYFHNNIKPLPEEQIKAWFGRQVYLALGVFLSACANMGVDSTPMEGIQTDKYDEILGLTDYKTLVAVAIGYRDEEDFNQVDRKEKSRLQSINIIKTI